MCFLGINDVSQLHLLGVRLDFTALPAQNASQRFCTDDPYIINQAEFMGNWPEWPRIILQIKWEGIASALDTLGALHDCERKSRMRARLHCSPDSKCIQRFCTDHPHREAVAKSVKMLSEFPNFMKHVLRCQYSTSLTFTRVWDSILLLYRSKMYASFLYGWSVHTRNHKMKLNQRKWIRWTRIVSQIK